MSGTRSRVTTHVLDAVSGRPAAGVRVLLQRLADGSWDGVGRGTTDEDGRVAALGPVDLDPGTYRVVFAVGEYFAAQKRASFYPEVVIVFTLEDADAHYHVPLLLSPYAYSTYRGS